MVLSGAVTAAAQGSPARETLVVPFESPQAVPSLSWLREGSAVLLTECLERYGAATVSRGGRLGAFDRLQLPPAATLSHATVIKVGQIVGASDVIVGSYELDGEELVLRVRRIELEPGRLAPELVDRGPLADLVAVFDRTARRLTGSAAAAPAPRAGSLLSSPAAIELFVKGLIAGSPALQRSYLEQAAKAAPAEDRIKLELWQVHADAGDYLRALDVVAEVPATSLHGRAARYLAARATLDLKRYDEALATLTALDAGGRAAEVLNALGVVQLRRGGGPPGGRPTDYFNEAVELDPAEADYAFNLGYAYWMEKDPPAATYWLREAVRRDPADGDAHYVLSAALRLTGATAEAERERELARRLSATYETLPAQKVSAEVVPRGLERLKDRLERPGARLAALITSAGQRDQEAQAVFHLEAGRRAFAREADREAEQELRRALYLSPYLSQAHLLLGRIHLRSGRTTEAIQAFTIALWSEASADGHLALAEAYLAAQNHTAAREEVERALALDPTSVAARALGEKIKALRRPP
jgi:tetratricopeptide (TPR) repeat protein